MRDLPDAKQSTIDRRRRAERQFRRGWEGKSDRQNPGATQARYTSGRGKKRKTARPNKSARLFSDSSILFDGLTLKQVSKTAQFIINFPKGRLGESHFAERFAREVKAIGNPRSVLADKKFIQALDKSFDMMIAEAKNSYSANLIALRQQQFAVARALFGLARAIGGL